MSEIRALSGDDLPAVATLLDSLLPGWGGDRAFLERTVLAHPWADSEIGSLVAIGADGELAGFIGGQVRRLSFEGRQLTGVCCSHLVVAPDSRAGATGALLLGRLLRGPQDLTWSDSASPTVARIWRTYGGQRDHTRSCDWMLVLRPLGWLGSLAGQAIRRRPIGRERVPVGSLPAHSIPRRRPPAADPEVRAQDASPTEIVEHLPGLTRRTRLRVDYDEQHLSHLFAQIRAREGELVCRLVRGRGGPIGWYAYLPRRERASRVLHLYAPEEHLDAVLGELIADARDRGARVLAGRLEPHLDAALQRRIAAIGLARVPVLHGRDPELLATLASGAGLLTQLDSEWFVT